MKQTIGLVEIPGVSLVASSGAICRFGTSRVGGTLTSSIARCLSAEAVIDENGTAPFPSKPGALLLAT